MPNLLFITFTLSFYSLHTHTYKHKPMYRHKHIFLENFLSVKCRYGVPFPINGLPWWLRWQRICLQCRTSEFDPWVEKMLWRREWLPTPVFLPGKFHIITSLCVSLKLGQYHSGSSTQYSVMAYMVKGSTKRLDMCVCVCVCVCVYIYIHNLFTLLYMKN